MGLYLSLVPQGEAQGKEEERQALLDFDSVDDILGRTLRITMVIDSAYGLSEKYCRNPQVSGNRFAIYGFSNMIICMHSDRSDESLVETKA